MLHKRAEHAYVRSNALRANILFFFFSFNAGNHVYMKLNWCSTAVRHADSLLAASELPPSVFLIYNLSV